MEMKQLKQLKEERSAEFAVTVFIYLLYPGKWESKLQ